MAFHRALRSSLKLYAKEQPTDDKTALQTTIDKAKLHKPILTKSSVPKMTVTVISELSSFEACLEPLSVEIYRNGLHLEI